VEEGGVVLLPDLSEPVFRKLLEFIYTGEVRVGTMRAVSSLVVPHARFAFVATTTNQITSIASASLSGELYQLAIALDFTALARKCALFLGSQIAVLPASDASTGRRHELADDLLQLLRDPQFSDCTLQVEQGEVCGSSLRAFVSLRLTPVRASSPALSSRSSAIARC
jgi:hypothetical protein